MSGNEDQESTIAANLCKIGCGFYGLTQFDGMCSVCYKEHQKEKQKQDNEKIQKPVTAAVAAAAVLSVIRVRESVGKAGRPRSKRAQKGQRQSLRSVQEENRLDSAAAAESTGGHAIATATSSECRL
uniref:A20-type domain-containing protein n=1 Tax=Macrostomum lignano TaxID=282301 RepID=A0A1I8FMN2_9PLAT